MNIIYESGKSPANYQGNPDKSFTINELKEIVGGECVVMYLPIESAYLIYNKSHSDEKTNGYNDDATTILKKNYKDSKVKIYGKSLLTSNI